MEMEQGEKGGASKRVVGGAESGPPDTGASCGGASLDQTVRGKFEGGSTNTKRLGPVRSL